MWPQVASRLGLIRSYAGTLEHEARGSTAHEARGLAFGGHQWLWSAPGMQVLGYNFLDPLAPVSQPQFSGVVEAAVSY